MIFITCQRRSPARANDCSSCRSSPRNRSQPRRIFPRPSRRAFQPRDFVDVPILQTAPPAYRMVRVHRLGQDRRPHLRRRPHPSRPSRKLETRPHLLQRAQVGSDDLPRDGPLPALERSRAQGRHILAANGHRSAKSRPPNCRTLAHPRRNLEHAPRRQSHAQASSTYFDRAKIATPRARRLAQIPAGRLMAQKPTVENRWWVETTKKPKRTKSETEMPQLPVAMAFYQVAQDYDQDRAKEDLTDNNLRIAREANPPQGGWAYLAMTEQHAPANVIKRVKDEFRIPREARGLVIDHGRVVRLLICGPQIEDWMLDITLGDEPSVDAYVWSVMYRERIFRRAEDALRQARKWAINLLQFPPPRDEPFRGALLV